MCWKAISSSDKWPSAQQKPDKFHLCWQRLCHEKSFIPNPSRHPYSKGSSFKMGAREQRRRGYSGGVRGTLGEKGHGGHTSTFQAEGGLWRDRQRQPSLLLAGTMWSSLLPLFAFRGALFHMQTVAVAPTCLAKCCIQTGRAEKRKRSGVRIDWGRRVGLRGSGYVRMPVLSGHWCHACAHRGRAAEGPRRSFFSFPPAQSLFPGWMNLSEAVAHCVP